MVQIKKLVVALRKFRSLHKLTGVALAFFILILSCTGMLLGLKKNISALQPVTRTGTSTDFSQWIGLEDISTRALKAMDSVGISGNPVDRMDVRADKGVVKVLFRDGYWEVQIDGATGKVLSIEQRHSDWIEHLHDGSILSDGFKLVYTNFMAIGLFTLAVSGVWMWIGPRIIRKAKKV